MNSQTNDKIVTFAALETLATSFKDVQSISIKQQIRSHVLRIGADVGNLCQKVLSHAPFDPYRTPLPSHIVETQYFPPTLADDSFWSYPSCSRDAIYKAIEAVISSLVIMSVLCEVDLRKSILKKIDLNRRKYPIALCKGKSGKYTLYSSHTGITRTEGQSTLGLEEEKKDNMETTMPLFDDKTISGMMLNIRKFATDRQWSRYHTPRNIVLAMMGEVGELAELFQWQGDGPTTEADKEINNKESMMEWTEEEFDHIQQELADVAIYTLRLADVCGIKNLGNVALQLKNV